MTLPLKFDLLFKTFNLGHNSYLIFHLCIPCDKLEDLSHDTIIFYLVMLTLKFDLLFKNFNLGHNLWTIRDRAVIFHMCIPCDNTFHIIPCVFLVTIPFTPYSYLIFHLCIPCDKLEDLSHDTIIFDLVMLTLKFDLLFKNFNLGHNLWTIRDRAVIFHMCIPCDNTFHIIPCVFLVTIPFTPYHVYSLWQYLSHDTIISDLVTLILKFGLLFKNFNLGHN